VTATHPEVFFGFLKGSTDFKASTNAALTLTFVIVIEELREEEMTGEGSFIPQDAIHAGIFSVFGIGCDIACKRRLDYDEGGHDFAPLIAASRAAVLAAFAEGEIFPAEDLPGVFAG
jgi:hypothetical protein